MSDTYIHKLGEYLIHDLIYEGQESLIYQGYDLHHQSKVVIKQLKIDCLHPEKIAQLQREYQITQQLQLDGIVNPLNFEWFESEHQLKQPGIILEDFGGDSLSNLGVAGELELAHFLEIAIALTQVLDQIHRAEIIHKNINPSNILYNPNTQQIKLTDFGIATVLTQETTPFIHPSQIEGTLAYIAPEQTGRTNYSLDYRCDYYALGVTFYKLLTGDLPFFARDALGWVHSHLAKIPTCPTLVNQEIPQPLAQIVLKLLAKKPRDRYQSSLGITTDLEHCLNQYRRQGMIQPFTLGVGDRVSQLSFPQQLYGRQIEQETLLNLFKRIMAGEHHWALVDGVSGVGKTALIKELYEPITLQEGRFIQGKYNQYQSNQPYAAFAHAFKELAYLILGESPDQIEKVKQKVLQAVGNNGQVLLDIVPIWESILGSQTPVAPLGWQETQNRFNEVIQAFISCLCHADHPLVLFIDDLQWADMASLGLIKYLLSQKSLPYFLLLGAYRSNEVKEGHPLLKTIEEITTASRKSILTLNQIHLKPLRLNDTNTFIADTLGVATSEIRPLSKLVYDKTQGNPFFTRQFLTKLVQDKLLVYDPASSQEGILSSGWRVKLNDIESLNYSDNVVDLMMKRLEDLPSVSLDLMKLAACLGDRFDLHSLNLISHSDPETTLSQILKPLQLGLLTPLNKNYKFLVEGDGSIAADIMFAFTHDHIQQATYSLLTAEEKRVNHLHIGRILHSNLIHEDQNWQSVVLYSVVKHLNLGSSLIEKQQDKQDLAQLNLRAGEKAQLDSAYSSANHYFLQGIELLKPLVCSTDSSLGHLYYSLLKQAATTSAILGDYASMEAFCLEGLTYAETPVEIAQIHQIEIMAAIAQNSMAVATNIALSTLEELGISVDPHADEETINQVLTATNELFSSFTPEEIIALPQQNDPKTLIIIEILNTLFSAYFSYNPQLLPLVFSQLIQTILPAGNVPLSPFIYASYGGFILCGLLQALDLGQRAGKIALDLLNCSSRDSHYLKARTLHIFYGFISHWQQPFKEVYPQFLYTYGIAMEEGDHEYATYAVHLYSFTLFLAGVDLYKVEQEMATYIEVIEDLNYSRPLAWQKVWWQAVVNLRGGSKTPYLFQGKIYHELATVESYEAKGEVTTLLVLYFLKAMLALIWGKYDLANEFIQISETCIEGGAGLPVMSAFYFYDGLIASVKLLPPEVKPGEGFQGNSRLQERITRTESLLAKWGQYSPSYEHRLYLFAAEAQRRQGNWSEALEQYDQAIDGAVEQELFYEAAFSAELTFKMLLAWQKIRLARVYFQESLLLYQRWGATGKLQDLKNRYPTFWDSVSNLSIPFLKTDSNKSSSENSNLLHSSYKTELIKNIDLMSLLKASQALSRELDLENLLSRMMTIVLENAGAEHGYLLLMDENGDLYIKAESGVDSLITIFDHKSVNELDNLANESEFYSILDYIQQNHKLCISNPNSSDLKECYCLGFPLLNQSNLIGILYLENRLIPHAFTEETIQLLTLLSSQIANSLINAQLYAKIQEYSHDLEEKVTERTQELEQLNQQLQQLAMLDGLTKISNRRYFDQYLKEQWQQAKRNQTYLSLILIDIDYFKLYNDFYGHQKGDECLIEFAQITSGVINRSGDLIARYGGEEFAVVLPNTNGEGAIAVAQGIQASLRKKAIPHEKSKVSSIVSISLGIASLIPTEEESIKSFIALADSALYAAKQQGRDRVHFYQG